jgi:hypothetical protein
MFQDNLLFPSSRVKQFDGTDKMSQNDGVELSLYAE